MNYNGENLGIDLDDLNVLQNISLNGNNNIDVSSLPVDDVASNLTSILTSSEIDSRISGSTVIIDDVTPSVSKVYSSFKTQDAINSSVNNIVHSNIVDDELDKHRIIDDSSNDSFSLLSSQKINQLNGLKLDTQTFNETMKDIHNTDPTISENFAAGFSRGHRWFNFTNEKAFTCVGDGIWKQISNETGLTINDTTPSLIEVYSSSKVESLIDELPLINDLVIDIENTYSSTKIEARLGDKADQTHITNNDIHIKNGIKSSQPTSTDDSSQDYDIGSSIVDTSNNQSWICTDNALNNAKWIETSNKNVNPTTNLTTSISLNDPSITWGNITIFNNYAYISGTDTNGANPRKADLSIYAVNGTSLTYLKTVNIYPNSVGNTALNKHQHFGQYLLLNGSEKGLTIMSLANPTNPSIVGTIEPANFQTSIAVGRYIYVLTYTAGNSIMTVYNFNDNFDIVAGSSSLSFSTGKYRNIAHKDGFLYVNIRSGAPSINGYHLIDISNPTVMSYLGNKLNYAFCQKKTIFIGNYYWLVDETPKTVLKVDISDVNNPQVVNTIPTTGERVFGLMASNKLICVIYEFSGMRVYDSETLNLVSEYNNTISGSVKRFNGVLYGENTFLIRQDGEVESLDLFQRMNYTNSTLGSVSAQNISVNDTIFGNVLAGSVGSFSTLNVLDDSIISAQLSVNSLKVGSIVDDLDLNGSDILGANNLNITGDIVCGFVNLVDVNLLESHRVDNSIHFPIQDGVDSTTSVFSGNHINTLLLQKAQKFDLTSHINDNSKHFIINDTIASNDSVYSSTYTDTLLLQKAQAFDLSSHENNSSNPHVVTKAQIGLSNVDNISANNIRNNSIFDNPTLIGNVQVPFIYTLNATEISSTDKTYIRIKKDNQEIIINDDSTTGDIEINTTNRVKINGIGQDFGIDSFGVCGGNYTIASPNVQSVAGIAVGNLSQGFNCTIQGQQRLVPLAEGTYKVEYNINFSTDNKNNIPEFSVYKNDVLVNGSKSYNERVDNTFGSNSRQAIISFNGLTDYIEFHIVPDGDVNILSWNLSAVRMRQNS